MAKSIAGLLALVALALAACGGGGGGGGGGSGSGTTNHAPMANAGAAQAVTTGALVTFSGAASSDPDGNAITYAWTLTSKPVGSTATLTGATTVSPTLRADLSGVYGVSLVVSDTSLSSAAATTTATATASPADLTAATNARATANVDLPASTITLQWQDSFPAGSSYRVESQASDGSFTAIETVVGGAGAITWARTYAGPVVYRITALTSGREIPVLTSSGAGLLDTTPIGSPSIIVSKPEPVSGTATLILAPAPGGSTLSWTADSAAIASGNGVSWNTSSLPDTTHLVGVHVDVNTGVSFDTRRTIATANTTLNVSASYQQLSATSLLVDVNASSPVGVASVEVRMDGGVPQTLIARNACGIGGCFGGGFQFYRFSYNPTTLGSGAHSAAIKVTDTAAGVKQITLPVMVANAPGLTVSSPSSGAFVFGNLTLTGTTTTDTGQPVTTTGALGGAQFMSTTAPNFSGSVSLAGKPVGTTLLVTQATDVNNKMTQVAYNVVVASSASLVLTPLFSVGETDVILAAEGDLVLYRTTNFDYFVRNVSGSASVGLAPVNGVTGRAWLTTDSVYGLGAGSDAGCKAGDTCIYRWSTTTGAVTNLSASDTAVPSAVVNQRSAPVVRGRYAVWRNQLANSAAITYTLYDSQTNTFTGIPTVTDFTASVKYDLAVVSGAPTLVYAATRSGSGITSEIVKWSSAGGTTVLVADAGSFVTTAGGNPGQLQTDGTSVAYLGGGGLITSLFILPIGGGATTTLDNSVGSFILRDGVATWRRVIFPTATKAWSAAQGVVTLDTTATPDTQQSAGSDFVTYHGFNTPGLRTWAGATGATALKADGGPYIPFITGNWLYFKSGTGIYRVPLT